MYTLRALTLSLSFFLGYALVKIIRMRGIFFCREEGYNYYGGDSFEAARADIAGRERERERERETIKRFSDLRS